MPNRPRRTRSERLQLWADGALDRWAPVVALALAVLLLGCILVAFAALIVEVLP